ncbi:unnamed protein product [Mycena citricolor]|uniref:PRTase-like protein n=1 Tax=Mycena citricolor TaxID=2018698 RepID=A0AAD2H1R4_9AGAR|nr:unnamed protein product [Mycena citricolor]
MTLGEGVEVEHLRVSYNDIHNLIKKNTPTIAAEFDPDLLVAIGGGGFFPARVMRTFLRAQTEHKALQIQAIGLSLYEPIEGLSFLQLHELLTSASPGTSVNQIGHEVIRTQWLGADSGKMLLGRKILIVDEVDDTRKTLHYAHSELLKDVEEELAKHPESEQPALRAATKFAVFVVHNKLKPKLAELPADLQYFAGQTVEDVWLDYPWESMHVTLIVPCPLAELVRLTRDIESHDSLAAADKQQKV